MSMQLKAGETHVGEVGGNVAYALASFARPADTNAYASGDLVANSTTAGLVVPMRLACARVDAGSFLVRRATIAKNSTSLTLASFRAHLYSTTPKAANGDNGAWSTDGFASYLGAFDATMDRAFTDGALGEGVPLIGSELSVQLQQGVGIFALLEARAAYTPVSAEVLSLRLELIRN